MTYLEVNNYLINKTITNVIATIYGAVEPGQRLRGYIYGQMVDHTQLPLHVQIAMCC